MEANESHRMDNSKLLELIQEWKASGESPIAYNKVIRELYDGNSFLVVETKNTPEEMRHYDLTKDDVRHYMPYYTVNGQKYFAAFTKMELFEKFMEGKPGFALTMPAYLLLETVDKTTLGGVIIDTNTKSLFVAYRRTDT